MVQVSPVKMAGHELEEVQEKIEEAEKAEEDVGKLGRMGEGEPLNLSRGQVTLMGKLESGLRALHVALDEVSSLVRDRRRTRKLIFPLISPPCRL